VTIEKEKFFAYRQGRKIRFSSMLMTNEVCPMSI